MCPRLNSLTYPRCSISARRNKTARSCTSAAAINECYQSPRSAILHSQRSNPHSDRPATDRTYSSAAPPPYLPRFPPLEVFGSPARTPAYLGSHVVHGPASENLHTSGPEQVQQKACLEGRCVTYSMTSSARARSVGGTSRPITLAVLRLMTSSSLVGNSIGRSPGLAPFRILTT